MWAHWSARLNDTALTRVVHCHGEPRCDPLVHDGGGKQGGGKDERDKRSVPWECAVHCAVWSQKTHGCSSKINEALKKSKAPHSEGEEGKASSKVKKQAQIDSEKRKATEDSKSDLGR